MIVPLLLPASLRAGGACFRCSMGNMSDGGPGGASGGALRRAWWTRLTCTTSRRTTGRHAACGRHYWGLGRPQRPAPCHPRRLSDRTSCGHALNALLRAWHCWPFASKQIANLNDGSVCVGRGCMCACARVRARHIRSVLLLAGAPGLASASAQPKGATAGSGRSVRGPVSVRFRVEKPAASHGSRRVVEEVAVCGSQCRLDKVRVVITSSTGRLRICVDRPTLC